MYPPVYSINGDLPSNKGGVINMPTGKEETGELTQGIVGTWPRGNLLRPGGRKWNEVRQ